MSEPKVKQWMRDAASELGNLDIDDFQREALTECDRDEDRANALMLERLAGVIAKHAPKSEPQPIRRGDVVQSIHFGHLYIVQSVGDDLLAMTCGNYVSRDNVTRIGRARYYPDGTPVEN